MAAPARHVIASRRAPDEDLARWAAARVLRGEGEEGRVALIGEALRVHADQVRIVRSERARRRELLERLLAQKLPAADPRAAHVELALPNPNLFRPSPLVSFKDEVEVIVRVEQSTTEAWSLCMDIVVVLKVVSIVLRLVCILVMDFRCKITGKSS